MNWERFARSLPSKRTNEANQLTNPRKDEPDGRTIEEPPSLVTPFVPLYPPLLLPPLTPTLDEKFKMLYVRAEGVEHLLLLLEGICHGWVGDGGGRQKYMDKLATLIVSCT